MDERANKIHLYGKLAHYLFWPGAMGAIAFGFLAILFSFITGYLLEQGQDPSVANIFMWLSLALGFLIFLPAGVMGFIFRCLLVSNKKKVLEYSDQIYDFKVY